MVGLGFDRREFLLLGFGGAELAFEVFDLGGQSSVASFGGEFFLGGFEGSVGISGGFFSGGDFGSLSDGGGSCSSS